MPKPGKSPSLTIPSVSAMVAGETSYSMAVSDISTTAWSSSVAHNAKESWAEELFRLACVEYREKYIYVTGFNLQCTC